MMFEGKRIFGVGIRFCARATGLALTALVCVLLFGNRVPNIFVEPIEVILEFAALGTMLAGFLAGWRWEGVGGVVSLLGFVVFCGIELIVNGRLPGGAIPLFAAPGVLLLLSHAISRKPLPRGGSSQPAN